MLSAVMAIAGVFLLVLISWLISYQKLVKKRKRYIHEKFGKIPKTKEWNDAVKGYYNLENNGSGIDDITWNDLEMNEVFLRIVQCDTSVGEEILYYMLRKNAMTNEERELFERSVQTWEKDEKEREEIEYLLCNIGKGDASYYIPEYLDSLECYLVGYQWLYRILQIVLAVSLVGVFVLPADIAAVPLAVAISVNLAVYVRFNLKHTLELNLAGTALSLLKNAKQLSEQSHISELFPDLQAALGELRGVMSGEKLLRIRKESSMSGDAVGAFLDYMLGITLCQITTYNKVMKQLRGNTDTYSYVYRSVGELDVAICIASFRKTLPVWCVPKYTETRSLMAEGVYHPLIREPVENDLVLEKGCLITGSNASGKSTFIKAVAVNAILGQAVNTCAAGRFVMPPAQVITSMAVKDDIMAGESYFVREIRYLKRILDNITEEQVTICAIDEILRGTNTGERIRASRAILEYLRDKNCIALVATHDKELTELLGDDYLNFHFSEEIGEDDITFSYRLLVGPATSQNAVKLLEFAGFPEEIIEAAQQTEISA